MHRLIACLFTLLLAGPALAEFSKINAREDFVRVVQGKELTLPLVNLRVSSNGRISGMGSRWEVEGNWTWKDGYFCRDLFWGGDALGYNCQEVTVRNNRIRFTSDRGRGESATFRLR